ncbi:MAG TPA: TetR/AcrR family transcriptional regulator [Nevskiaceae bacterium]|nr:TetR/AcrR family transcriptional regulator [Nevskiaceae bacterium]
MKRPFTPPTVLHQRLASEARDLPAGEDLSGSRGAVLTAALHLFARQGYGGTSVRDMAKAADLQPATLYAWFPSKQHVLAELARIGHEEHHRRLRAALLESGSDPAEQLRALVIAHVRMHTDFPMLGVVANAELHALTEAFAARALELRRQSEHLLLDVVQRGIDRGRFRVPTAWMAVTAIGGMGVRVAHWFTAQSGVTPDSVAQTYADFALRIVDAV